MTDVRNSGGTAWRGRALVSGEASGPPLHSALALSFWGGVDPMTGVVIDRHHPLTGLGIADKVLVFPGSRGSSTGSGVLLELLLNGVGPAALIVERGEEVLTLGAIIAEELFGRRLPIVEVDPAIMPKVAAAPTLWIKGDVIADNALALSSEPQQRAATTCLRLTDRDRKLLDGVAGQAAQKAMRIVCRMAEIVGAEELIDVTRAHIDGCIYTGAGGLAFAEHFRDLGGHVAVPTTLNAVSVDCRHWRDQGVAADFGEPAQRLAEAYVALGASPTFTCAPYLRDSVPALGEQIAWAEFERYRLCEFYSRRANDEISRLSGSVHRAHWTRAGGRLPSRRRSATDASHRGCAAS